MDHFAVEAASETLHAQGFRVTAQRRLILEALEEADEHLDAETLYQRLRKRDRSIGLATVYRTLNVLHQAGLIEQRYLDQDHSRGYYEVHTDEHYHFTCRQCGKVVEFETDLVATMRRELRERYGAQVEVAALHLEGLCADCRIHHEQE